MHTKRSRAYPRALLTAVAAVRALRGPVLQPHPGLADDAERPLGAGEEAVGRRPGARAGQARRNGDAGRCHHAQALDELVDVRVAGREVSAAAGRDPAAERAELERLRVVAQREPVRPELVLERRSEHPIAEAIVREAERRRVPVVASTDVVSLPGRGVEGRVPDGSVLLGNLALFRERGLDGPELTRHVADLGEAGHTAVLVAEDGRVVGAIAVADRARESARDALDLLRRQGVECLVMLTGDSEAAAREVARTVGVDELKAGLMPEDKVSAIEDLRRRYGAVAMVGDGVNDAPALASADLGIAMGAAGSDAALETADVALMADELLKIPYAFRVSRSAMRNIKTNLAVSLVLKAAFVIATIAGVASLWMAVLADTGASMIVVANALRLLRHE